MVAAVPEVGQLEPQTLVLELQAEEQTDQRPEVAEEPETQKDLDHKLEEPAQPQEQGEVEHIAERQMDQRMEPEQSDFVQPIAAVVEDWQSWVEMHCNYHRMDQKEPGRTVVAEVVAETPLLPWPNYCLVRPPWGAGPIDWFVEVLESLPNCQPELVQGAECFCDMNA